MSINFAVLGFTRSTRPSDIKDVSNISELGELGLGFIGVGDIALNVFDRVIGVPGRSRATSHAVDLPRTAGSVGEREDLGETVADDAGHADH